jgi:DNA-directed RNA polymerase specialized sigma24 family protein
MMSLAADPPGPRGIALGATLLYRQGPALLPSGGRPISRRRRIGFRRMSDHELVRLMVAGDAAAVKALAPRMQNCVWTACLALSGEAAKTDASGQRLAREGFREIWADLATESFGSCRGWDGRSGFEAFLTLLVRERLLQRIHRLLGQDQAAGWAAFCGYFDGRIRKRVTRYAAHAGDAEDAYQEVNLALWEAGCRRLRAFPGQGSFEAFVLSIVDRLLIDNLRRRIGRRRLPAAIEALSEFDQAVFAAIHWDGVAAEASSLLAALASRYPAATRPEIDAARERVLRLVAAGYAGARAAEVSLDAETPEANRLRDSLADPGHGMGASDPHGILEEKQEAAVVGAAGAALVRAMAELEDEDRAYLHAVLNGIEKPRDIARFLGGVPIERVYLVKARVQRRLQAILAKDLDVQAWRVDIHEAGRMGS